MAAFPANPAKYVQLVAHSAPNAPVGLAEASIREEYVNEGTTTSPVAYLEGLYVVPHAGSTGVATSLVDAVASWATERGCAELASDASIANEVSQAVHKALGFVETDRVAFFRRSLASR